MLILFQPACFSSSGSDLFNIRKINSKFSQLCLFHPSQGAFVFPALPPFSFKESDVVTKYPFYSREVPSFFSINVLTRWFSWRCSSSLLFFVLFLLRWTQVKLSVLIIAFSSFQMLSHAGISLNHSPLAIQLFWSAEDISKDSCFHSASILTISRLLPHSSHLIQPVQSPFQVIISTVFLLSGP